jgi:hypothetical protein
MNYSQLIYLIFLFFYNVVMRLDLYFFKKITPFLTIILVCVCFCLKVWLNFLNNIDSINHIL